MIKKGTLVDASVIEADAARPSLKQGDVSPVDPDATFTHKHGKTYFGYKMHIGVDQGSGLIRRLLTDHSIHPRFTCLQRTDLRR